MAEFHLASQFAINLNWSPLSSRWRRSVCLPCLLLNSQAPSYPENGQKRPNACPYVGNCPSESVCHLLFHGKDQRKQDGTNNNRGYTPEPHQLDQHLSEAWGGIISLQECCAIDLSCSSIHCNDVLDDRVRNWRADTTFDMAAHSERKLRLSVDRNPTDSEHEAHNDVSDGHWHSEDAHKGLFGY